MKHHQIRIDQYNEYLLRAEFYYSIDNPQNMVPEKQIIAEKFRDCTDPQIKLTILLHQYITGDKSIDDLLNFVADWEKR